MQSKAGSFSVANPGNASVTGLPFLPSDIVIRIGPSVSTLDLTKIARSDGWATASNSSYDSTYWDSTGSEQVAGTGQIIRLRKRTSGVIGDAVAATFVSFDTIISGSNYGFTLNFTTTDVNKQIRYIVRG